MPKRSTPFQTVVKLLHTVLKPAGYRVTESRMVTDADTGVQREIDVCLESDAGGIPVVVAIEVREHKRPQDVKWIEELWGRYSQSGYRVVAVSKSGFNRPAKAKATARGIHLLTLEQATQIDWIEFVNSLRLHLVEREEHVTSCSIESDEYLPVFSPSSVFFDGNGTELGNAAEVFSKLSDQPWFNRLLDNVQKQPDEIITVKLAPPSKLLASGTDGRPHLVGSVSFQFRSIVRETPIPLVPARYADTNVATASVYTSEWAVQAVLADTGSGTRLAFQIDSSSEPKTKDSRRRPPRLAKRP